MIPGAAITAWGVSRQWPTRAAVEQDLLLARVIVGIYQHPVLTEELVFRGGTCLHQLHLPVPYRYSEDLDFVRSTHGGIGAIFDALREVADEAELQVKSTNVGAHPKLAMRATSEDGLPLRIKVEINTHETSPARPTIRMPFTVSSGWFTGQAEVLTFTSAELIATKIRALYQRKKGRDLFDLWLALNVLGVAPTDVLACFGPYRPDGLTARTAIDNLHDKLTDPVFVSDLDQLVTSWPRGYSPAAGGAQIESQLLTHL